MESTRPRKGSRVQTSTQEAELAQGWCTIQARIVSTCLEVKAVVRLVIWVCKDLALVPQVP